MESDKFGIFRFLVVAWLGICRYTQEYCTCRQRHSTFIEFNWDGSVDLNWTFDAEWKAVDHPANPIDVKALVLPRWTLFVALAVSADGPRCESDFDGFFVRITDLPLRFTYMDVRTHGG